MPADLEIVSVRLGRAETTTRIPIYEDERYEAYYEDWFHDDGSYHPLFWLIDWERNSHLSVQCD